MTGRRRLFWGEKSFSEPKLLPVIDALLTTTGCGSSTRRPQPMGIRRNSVKRFAVTSLLIFWPILACARERDFPPRENGCTEISDALFTSEKRAGTVSQPEFERFGDHGRDGSGRIIFSMTPAPRPLPHLRKMGAGLSRENGDAALRVVANRPAPPRKVSGLR